MIFPCRARREAGTTLIETLVAATIVAAFFVSIFEVNALCLRYIGASKECVAAVQGVQDRIEGLRNLDFNNLISSTYMISSPATSPSPATTQVSLFYPSNGSDFAAKVTEEVTVSGYPCGLRSCRPLLAWTRASTQSTTISPLTFTRYASSTTLVGT